MVLPVTVQLATPERPVVLTLMTVGGVCQNGGTCVDQLNAFFCDCVDGYTGDMCETRKQFT